MSSQSDFVWIDRDVVLAIHEAQIAEHGGALGVRDPGLLASALDRPRNAFNHSDTDVAQLAALYALGILKNHPFLDGNKRVGAVLLELFLNLNDHVLAVEDESMLQTILGVAAGEISDRDFVDWVRSHALSAAAS